MSIQRLHKMIEEGKTYNYRGQAAVLKRYTTHHDIISIDVELNGVEQTFTKETEDKLALFLECFTEAPGVHVASNLPATNGKQKEAQQPLIYTETKDVFKSLTQTLLEDIEKVRTKPEYVGQAKQVCNNISAIVNITKLQLQLLQEG